jgi:hypothetical protein
VKAKYRKGFVQRTFATLDRKQHLKLNVLRSLHLVPTAWSPVTSDTREHCFSEAEYGVVDFNRDLEDEKVEVKM